MLAEEIAKGRWRCIEFEADRRNEVAISPAAAGRAIRVVWLGLISREA